MFLHPQRGGGREKPAGGDVVVRVTRRARGAVGGLEGVQLTGDLVCTPLARIVTPYRVPAVGLYPLWLLREPTAWTAHAVSSFSTGERPHAYETGILQLPREGFPRGSSSPRLLMEATSGKKNPAEDLMCGRGIFPDLCSPAPVRLTVWCKSLLFHGHGYTVYDDSDGRMVFRVDNYAHNWRQETVLMDYTGNVLLTIRRRRKVSLQLFFFFFFFTAPLHRLCDAIQ
ncbi:hypothetical protein BHM03_00008554 [Ensete ventricosum]|nr:hypothetical protein BHM03_00008554 [Ensete ventricosum]